MKQPVKPKDAVLKTNYKKLTARLRELLPDGPDAAEKARALECEREVELLEIELEIESLAERETS